MGRRAWVIAALIAAGCSGNSGSGGSTGGPCVDGDAHCGKHCGSIQPCAAGLYCAVNGTCAKECVASAGTKKVSSGCGAGKTCSAAGQCLANDGSGGSHPIPGGHAPDGG